MQLRAACPSCTVVAGDVLDSGSYVNWLRRFQSVATADLWGLHNYADVTYGTTTGTDNVLAATTGTLWIEETGGIVVRRGAAGQILLAYDEARAARAVTNAFALTKTRPRIERVYIYQWRAGATDLFDAGILRPDGSERPSYAALVAATRAPAQTPSPGMTWKASWSKGRLILRGTCAVKPCRGTVTVSLRHGRKTIKRYKARTTARRCASRSRTRSGARCARRRAGGSR